MGLFFGCMTKSLLKLVASSGLYDRDRSAPFKNIVRLADQVAQDRQVSRGGALDEALEDIYIPEEKFGFYFKDEKIPFQELARRTEDVRLTVVRDRKRNVPVVQVLTMLEAIIDYCQIIYNGRGGHERRLAEQWSHNAQSLSDPRMVFYTVAVWLGYLHTKAPAVSHKRYDENRAILFENMIDGQPRLQYPLVRDATKDLALLAERIGTSRFEKNVHRRYFDL